MGDVAGDLPPSTGPVAVLVLSWFLGQLGMMIVSGAGGRYRMTEGHGPVGQSQRNPKATAPLRVRPLPVPTLGRICEGRNLKRESTNGGKVKQGV